jgi:phenylacetate-CoA ligase
MPDLLSLYHYLPYPLRSLMASLHGFRLSMLRYSANTDRLVAEAYEREQWTVDQWSSWQEDLLARVLTYAAENVPYYRKMWTARRRNGNRTSLELLQNWPVLRKDVVRDNPHAFLADGTDLRTQIIEHTSGTTGMPLTFFMSKDAVRQWYALFEARWRGWYGLSRQDNWGILGGQLVVPYSQGKPPFWVWNGGMKQLYLSSYHISSKNTEAYLQAMRKHNLVYILGYASSLYSLALQVLEQKLKLPSMKAVISNAEPLYAHQRELIAKAFQCPVYDTYGLSENVCAASECLYGHLHLWPEVGKFEIFDDKCDEPLSDGETGRLICTGFLNKTMPLIRYEVGDRAFFSPDSFCACGRTMPILGGIDGRNDDVIITSDGRRIGRLDTVFKAEIRIQEAQIIQEDFSRIRVLYVPTSDFSTIDKDVFLERLHAHLGDMQIIFQEVDQIPRTSNGKFRAVISMVK